MGNRWDRGSPRPRLPETQGGATKNDPLAGGGDRRRQLCPLCPRVSQHPATAGGQGAGAAGLRSLWGVTAPWSGCTGPQRPHLAAAGLAPAARAPPASPVAVATLGASRRALVRGSALQRRRLQLRLEPRALRPRFEPARCPWLGPGPPARSPTSP